MSYLKLSCCGKFADSWSTLTIARVQTRPKRTSLFTELQAVIFSFAWFCKVIKLYVPNMKTYSLSPTKNTTHFIKTHTTEDINFTHILYPQTMQFFRDEQ